MADSNTGGSKSAGGRGGNVAALAGVVCALTAFGMAQGLSYPLFTLLMQRQGMSPAAIGASAAMMPIGLVLSAALIPPAVRRWGAPALASACAVLAAAGFLAVWLLQDWFAWYVIRFLFGFVVNPLYVLGEVWAMALAPPGKRGRVMGIFNAVMGAGYASGPLALAVVGIEGVAPFAVGIVGFLSCAAILVLVSDRLRGFEEDEPSDSAPVGGILWFAPLAPALLVAVGVGAANQQSTYSLMPLFGAGYGLSEALLPALVTALSMGNILLQVPLGLAAERLGARTMIVTCATATGTCALLLPALIHTPAVWPVLVVMGGVGYGVYTMALVELGERFRGRALVAGNAAFALMWGAGGIVGPPGAGILMQQVGPMGLPVLICVLSAGLVSFALWRAAMRARP
jgi:MFS family permease